MVDIYTFYEISKKSKQVCLMAASAEATARGNITKQPATKKVEGRQIVDRI